MRAGLAIVLVTVALAPAAAAPAAKIIDWPISFDAERKALSLAYLRAHVDPAASSIEITPKVIVIHYTGGHSAKATFHYFDATRIEQGRKQLRRASQLNVSAHFLVDRDGTIYRLVPETRLARHTIGLNQVAIGIENVGDGDRYPLTRAQLAADAALVRDLAARYPITHLIGHYEARALEGHIYYTELDPTYRNEKADPGKGFMRELRAEVADLGLLGPPDADAR